MNTRLTARGTLSAAIAASILAGGSMTLAHAAEIDHGSDDEGIIRLDNDITGVTYGDGKAPDRDTAYNDPVAYDGELSDTDRTRLMTALIIGQSIADGSFDTQASELLDGTAIDAGQIKDTAAEAVSQIVSSILAGDSLPEGNPLVDAVVTQIDNIDLADDNPALDDAKILIASPEDDAYTNLVVFTDSGIPSLADIVNTVGEESIQIRTSAGVEGEGETVSANSVVVDTVRYTGLTPGEEYTLEGQVVGLAGEGYTINNDNNTGSQTFTPDEDEGTVEVRINVSEVESDEIVVFETLYDSNGDVVAEHKDINDQAQTLATGEGSGAVPSIRTSADSTTGGYIQSGTVVSDTVSYSGLTPGKSYRLEARLMCGTTGQQTDASATHEFTPENADGSVTVAGLSVTDPNCLEQVVFEKLYDNETDQLVASHEDINDQAQTIGSTTDTLGKKKEVPVKESPAPVSPEDAPRQVINDAPSGASSAIGASIFTR